MDADPIAGAIAATGVTGLRHLRSPIEPLGLLLGMAAAILRALFVPRTARITPTQGEHLMLAISGVNQCAYCSYLHTQTALSKGVDLDTIQQVSIQMEEHLRHVPSISPGTVIADRVLGSSQ